MSMKKIPDSIEKRFLEEYRELGLCWRHDDEWFSKLTAVLLPLSIGALTLPYLKVGVPKLLAVIGGLMLIFCTSHVSRPLRYPVYPALRGVRTEFVLVPF